MGSRFHRLYLLDEVAHVPEGPEDTGTGKSTKGRIAAEAIVQRPEHRVLKTRHHDWKPWLPTENGFREVQSIDLLCGNDHHLKPLENGPLRDIHAVTG